MAWRSFCGFQSESHIITVEARVRFIPSYPSHQRLCNGSSNLQANQDHRLLLKLGRLDKLLYNKVSSYAQHKSMQLARFFLLELTNDVSLEPQFDQATHQLDV